MASKKKGMKQQTMLWTLWALFVASAALLVLWNSPTNPSLFNLFSPSNQDDFSSSTPAAALDRQKNSSSSGLVGTRWEAYIDPLVPLDEQDVYFDRLEPVPEYEIYFERLEPVHPRATYFDCLEPVQPSQAPSMSSTRDPAPQQEPQLEGLSPVPDYESYFDELEPVDPRLTYFDRLEPVEPNKIKFDRMRHGQQRRRPVQADQADSYFERLNPVDPVLTYFDRLEPVESPQVYFERIKPVPEQDLFISKLVPVPHHDVAFCRDWLEHPLGNKHNPHTTEVAHRPQNKVSIGTM